MIRLDKSTDMLKQLLELLDCRDLKGIKLETYLFNVCESEEVAADFLERLEVFCKESENDNLYNAKDPND